MKNFFPGTSALANKSLSLGFESGHLWCTPKEPLKCTAPFGLVPYTFSCESSQKFNVSWHWQFLLYYRHSLGARRRSHNVRATTRHEHALTAPLPRCDRSRIALRPLCTTELRPRYILHQPSCYRTSFTDTPLIKCVKHVVCFAILCRIHAKFWEN